MNLLMGED